MNKLYIGNLPADVNEGTLRQLFLDKGINCTNVLVKKGGYAFVDCPDQTTADRAIDSLNGYSFMGTALLVEPSVPRGRSPSFRSRTNRVQLSNVPAHVKWEDIESLIANFGTVQKCDQVPGNKDNNTCVHVTYETQDQAQQAVTQLNNYEYEGSLLKVDYVMEQNRQTRQPRGRPTRGGLQYSGMPGTTLRSTDFPLRILVLSEMVGAIIGRQGGTIRQITQQTRARVDVHRKDNAGSLEKQSPFQAITVYGAPENCTNACRKILEVMCQEAQNTNKGEIPLKILAHNNLIGRIIGKNGNTIKHIMQETDTKITVSSIHDVNSFNLERTITIKGTVENMSKAEALISAKLRQSYENDLAAMAPGGGNSAPLNASCVSASYDELPAAWPAAAELPLGGGGGFQEESDGAPDHRAETPQTMMFPGLHPMAMMSTLGAGFPRGPAPYGMYGSGSYMPTMYPGSMVPSQQAPPQETTFLYIPNAAVGAIIGTKGTHIRNIIRFSGASVKIAPLNKDEPADHTTERKVTIVGTPEAQWKAQFLIFEKMREEGFAGTDDVRLKVEIMVPSTQVGRIIGKGGQNVRELQRVTGSIIKLPEESQSTSAEETSVHIIGPFYSVQSAQRRIRAMITQSQMPPQIQRRRGQRGDQN